MARADPRAETESQTPAPGVKSPAPGERMTYEEFLAWCDEDTWAEWVDGEVIMVSPASTRHADLAAFLTIVLRLYVKVHALGMVLAAPFQMKLSRAGSGREPDLLFVAREHLDRLLPTRLQGPADLVVEIISPESVGRDRGDKYVEYEAAGIPEYWLIDPDRRRAEFHRLGLDGYYELVSLEPGGVFRSEVLPGFWLRVDWLWEEPTPDIPALRELGILAVGAAEERQV